ncbi:MAG: hypothetical protein HZB46_07965 [Solirubrobacterales bacterium]|nr:hypothetical protein [Solirubrobacterales bacterium]
MSESANDHGALIHIRTSRRLVLPCLLLGAFAVAPATSQAALYGFSEQQPEMFTNPLYQDLSKVKIARYIAPYDVATDARDKAIFDRWYAAARADKQRVLVSFYYDRDRPLKLPSTKLYTSKMKAFKKAYPKITEISPYNEANRDARKQRRFAGPSAKQAANYYLAARKVFKGKKYKIVGLDLLDGNSIKPSIKYLKAFQRYTRKHPNKIWGLHNYSDTNRNSTKRTKAVLAQVKGEVWLTETGGLVKLGTSFAYSEARAARALKNMFKLASNKRIKRLYIYQWSPGDDQFDAGLIGKDGSPRPGYDVVKKKLG